MKKEAGEGIVKIIRWGRWSLIHSRYINEWGMLCDAFELREHRPYEMSLVRPFLPPLKVSSYTREDSISTYTNYTNKEYEEMLAAEIQKAAIPTHPKTA